MLYTHKEVSCTGILTQIVSKLTRYAENFSEGGHKDSVIDACTYCAMLMELDYKQIMNAEENNPNGQ